MLGDEHLLDVRPWDGGGTTDDGAGQLSEDKRAELVRLRQGNQSSDKFGYESSVMKSAPWRSSKCFGDHQMKEAWWTLA